MRGLKPWLTSPWALITYLVAGLALLDPGQVLPIGEIALRALVGTLPYIVLAVLLLAYLKAAGAEAMISQAFKGRETRMIVLATLFGGLAPFCSCQVIPFVAGLLALGTPLPAVMAFWLSSQLIDPSSILITAAALGWPMAIPKTLSAVGLGLFGGFALKGMMGAGFFKDALRAEVAPSGCCCKARTTVGAKPVWQVWREDERRTIFRAEMTSNVLFLFKWLALA
nr:permease [Breoghania sp.]